mgnify:CR=1 FL=1
MEEELEEAFTQHEETKLKGEFLGEGIEMVIYQD